MTRALALLALAALGCVSPGPSDSPDARRAAREALQAIPPLRAMDADRPEVGARFEAVVVEETAKGASLGDAVGRATDRVMDEYAWGYVTCSSDEALLSFAAGQAVLLDELAARDALACYGFVYGKPGERGYDLELDHRQEQRLLDSLTGIVQSAIAASPCPPLDPAANERALDEFFAHVRARRGDPFVRSVVSLSEPRSPDVDRAHACSLNAELYREVLAMPAGKSARVLRAMFAPGSGAEE